MTRWRVFINGLFHGSVMADNAVEADRKARKKYKVGLEDELKVEQAQCP